MSSLKFAIIGAGNIGRIHAEAIARIPGARLTVVCNRGSGAGMDLAKLHGAEWIPRYQDAVQHPEVDVVSICTPSGTHAEIAETAAAAGKHLLVGEATRHHTVQGGSNTVRRQPCQRNPGECVSVAVHERRAPGQASPRCRAPGAPDAGRCPCQVVSPSLLLRGGLARHLGAGRWRGADEPVDTQHRFAAMAGRAGGLRVRAHCDPKP